MFGAISLQLILTIPRKLRKKPLALNTLIPRRDMLCDSLHYDVCLDVLLHHLGDMVEDIQMDRVGADRAGRVG